MDEGSIEDSTPAAAVQLRSRLHATFQHCAIGLAHVDLQGRFLAVNPALCELTGYTAEELCQKAFFDITHPEDVAADWAKAQRLVAGEIASYSMQKRYVCKSGSVVWVQLEATLARDDTGEPFLIAAIQNIDAQKRAERESRKLLELVEHSADLIGTADLDGRLTYLNPGGRRLLGVAPGAPASGLHFADYVPEAWRAFFQDTMLASVQRDGLWTGEMQLQNVQTGELLDVSRSTFLLRNPDTGEPWCYATVTRDITQRKQAERSLRQSEATLRSLTDSALFMMGVVELPEDDSDIFHIYDSPASYRFFGAQPGALAGASSRAMGVPEATVALWVKHYRQSQRTGQPVRFEYDNAGPDGRSSMVCVVACIGPSSGGRTRFSYVAEDVTARKRADAELRDRETHLSLALEMALLIVFEWDIQRNRVRRLLSREVALPESRDSTFEEVARVVHPEDRALFVANAQAAVRSTDGAYHSEFRIVRPGGEVRWLLESGRVTFDAERRPLRLIGISKDITERRQAEERLRRQAQLINLSHEAIMAWSPEHGVLEWNTGAERLYGYTAAEALGRDIHDLLATQPRPSHSWGGGGWTGELRHTAKDGRALVVESRQQAIELNGERVILESNRDITERKRAEQALREAARRKDEFISVLAHELRNPLAPVRSAVEIIRRLAPSEPRLARARDVIDRQLSHMSRLIDDLLDISRIARGKLTLKPEPCDLRVIIRQTSEDYRAMLEAAGLTLVLDTGEQAIWVLADPVRLAQMLGNLLHNAARFAESGLVEVRARLDAAQGHAVISVSDTGVGIEPELLSRLFDPFSQAEQGLARSKGGLGLGLALTRGLAELQGGSIEAASPGPGGGSTFTLRLPLSGAHSPAPETPRASLRPRGLKVLVVEDNQDAAESLRDLLELGGHQVRVAFDGASGVRIAGEFLPDAVISDIGLPGELDGYDVARALRRGPAAAGVLLVALSGYASEDARRRSRDAGFDAHLAKPMEIGELERLLRRCHEDKARAQAHAAT